MLEVLLIFGFVNLVEFFEIESLSPQDDDCKVKDSSSPDLVLKVDELPPASMTFSFLEFQMDTTIV